MKNILLIIIIIVMLIGIYAYSHVNRYYLVAFSDNITTILLDRWTGRTYFTHRNIAGKWIDIGKPEPGKYTIPLKRDDKGELIPNY